MTSGNVSMLDRDLAPAAFQASAQNNGHHNALPTSPELPSSPLTAASRTLESVERDHILAVLEQTGWVVEGAKDAAIVLNLNPNTHRSRMKKLGIYRANRRPAHS